MVKNAISSSDKSFLLILKIDAKCPLLSICKNCTDVTMFKYMRNNSLSFSFLYALNIYNEKQFAQDLQFPYKIKFFLYLEEKKCERIIFLNNC